MEKQYNPQKTEKKWYDYWVQKGYFSASRDSSKSPFSIVIPPPNITGILHMGHALNNTIQDVLVRYKRMEGASSLWMPGTDHAGIATQNVVEKDLIKQGTTKEDLGRDKFVEKLWEWKDKYGSTIINQLKMLGASCDWDRLRFTLDSRYSEAVKEVFVSLYNKGLVYRGNYIINWCPRCKTALADEEAPYKELQGKLYYIKYPLKKKVEVRGEKLENNQYITVATTRPETMLGDTAVAVNPSDTRYSYLKDYDVILPIMERKLKIIEDEVVDPEFGTGLVKVTPAHDRNDFDMGQKHKLESINIMDENSVLNENTGLFKGKDRFQARKEIVEKLKEKGLLEKEEEYKVNAGHCYRCDTMVEPRLSKQWFVNMKPLAQPAIKAVKDGKISFYPERWEKVYLNWMENIQDWCISRQIWWGHRLPVYYCNDCLEKEDSGNKGIIVSKEKVDTCPFCGSDNVVQDKDVLDTWFSSWLWPFATFGWPFRPTDDPVKLRNGASGRQTMDEANSEDVEEAKKDLNYFYPTSVLVTASEILFFWVARMIMSGLEFMGQIPFKKVFIHGTIRDIHGVKMSKSLGNVIDPLEIIEKYGADSLRFSLIFLVSSGSDAYLSEEKFVLGRNFSNKIWNAARYIISKTDDNQRSNEEIDVKDLTVSDKWILNELNKLIEEVTEDINNSRVSEAAKNLYYFFWHKFCDWYLEISKVEENANKNKILIITLKCFLKMLHPFMPYITEEIWQKLRKNNEIDSIMVSKWPNKIPLDIEQKEIEDFVKLQNLAVDIRTFKRDLSLNKKINFSVWSPKGENVNLLKQNKEWVELLGRGIIFPEEYSAEGKVVTKNADYDIAIDKKVVKDLEQHKNRMGKKIEDISNLIGKQQKKLNNKSFIQKAPSEVVEGAKDKLSDLVKEKERLERIKWG